MSTTTKFNKDAIDAVYEGVREVAEAVATTLGPMGRNVLVDRGYQTSIIHDGVNVSLVINPKEPFKRNGALLMQEAAKKQRDEVGDGTTAVCVLTMAILDETLKATASGINPMTLRKGLESGARKVIKKIEELSTPVTTLKQKIQIATISAEDESLGKLVAETIHKIGVDGILTVEESKAADTYVEHQEGMQIDRGYAHPYFITDPERMIAVLEDTPILVTDIPITELAMVGQFMERIVFPNTKKLLILSPEFGNDFLSAMVGARIAGKFLPLAIKAPGAGQNQSDILQDIAALTGATFITKEANQSFDTLTYDVLGKVGRVVSNKISTIITNGAGHKEDVLQRIAIIKAQMEDDTISEFDREQLKARLGKLTSGVAVIKVAGQTEVEMKERKERAEDARCATQAAVKHGAVPGGEVVYLSCIDELDDTILGEKILKQALKAPFRRLVENAGYDAGEKLNALQINSHYVMQSGTTGKILGKVDNLNTGFDVIDGTFKDMVKSGIIDPTSVPVQAIKTAVSVSVALSSLGAAIVQDNNDVKDK